jgi:hypothetical protein
VSVRSAREAVAALAGGCDVLDVKEPSRGSLGMADVTTIKAIVELAQAHDPVVPVSIALGEAAEWPAQRQSPGLPPGIAYAKLGTANLPCGDQAASQFSSVRRRIESDIVTDCASSAPRATGFAPAPRWIAVAYADFELACAPSPEEVIELASACGCAGLLVDTFTKDHKRLIDWLDDDRLISLAAQSRSLGLTFALAGRLQAGDLSRVLQACPDIIGIRSAACRAGQRTGSIDAEALRAFRLALQGAAASQFRSVDFSPRVASVNTIPSHAPDNAKQSFGVCIPERSLGAS